jgi:transposase
VARTKDQSQAERNRRICLLRRNGYTYSEIAQMEQISRVRVAQIVAEYNAEIPEDEGRAKRSS